jgi:hypothetical protein
MSRRIRNLRGTNAAQGIAQVAPGPNPHGVHFTSKFNDLHKTTHKEHSTHLPSQPILHFQFPCLLSVEFLSDGLLADRTKSQQPLLSREKARLYAVPYRQWAPASHWGQIRSANTLSECILVLSGLEDFLLGSWSIDLETYTMKSRVLQGLLPLSDRRWQQKQLDGPANFKQAC